MNSQLLNVWSSPLFWVALFAFAAVLLSGVWFTDVLSTRLEAYPLSLWLLQNLGVPFARVLAMAAFLLIGYPVIFGLATAPASLASVFSQVSGRSGRLVDIMFFVTILASVIPVLSRFHALSLPAAGIAGSALLMSWVQESMAGQPGIHYWPGLVGTAGIIGSAILAHALGIWGAEWLEADPEMPPQAATAVSVLQSLLILVPVLIYALFLGGQFAS